MALEMTLDYRLRWLDFDRYGRIKPTTVLGLMQDVATVQAQSMGIGRDDMLARGVFWAIVRAKFEVLRQPRSSQEVLVRTWPHTPSRFSFLRDFTISDASGELLVKATSEWVLMDFAARKFASIKDHYDGPDELIEERTFDSKPRKLPDFEGNRPEYTVVPAYSDIDMNGHVNNARYPTFAVNALDPDPDKALKAFQIDYRHEVLPNAPLVIHTRLEDGLARSKGVKDDGTTAFSCLIEFE